MLWIPKTTYAQQCCALKGKLRMKEIANKIMMRDLIGVKRQRFFGVYHDHVLLSKP